MRSALADSLGDVVLGMAVAVDQRAVAQRLFDGVQIGALDVLDNADFGRPAV
jgi:hypothetical protein